MSCTTRSSGAIARHPAASFRDRSPWRPIRQALLDRLDRCAKYVCRAPAIGGLAAVLLVALAPLAGRAAQDSEAAVRAAVEYANSPDIWGEALRRGDPAPLALAWEGDPLGYFSNEVLKYRARGLRLVSRLETLEWVAVHVSDDARAEVYTREWWRDFICTDQGEPRGWREASVADHYRLTLGSAGWRISGVDVTLLAGSFDWSPTEDMPDALAACRSVLPDAP